MSSHKFSIVIEIVNGKPVATGYHKADAQQASEHFIRLRNEEKEAYFFQHPVADRRSKSATQIEATLGLRDANGKVPDSVAPQAPKQTTELKPEIVNKVFNRLNKIVKRNNNIQGVSSGEAIDLP